MDQSENTGDAVVSLDVATQEINAWLEYKKISASKREAREDQIKTIISAISEGWLTLEKSDDELRFVQKLRIPFGKDIKIKELKYLSRVPIDLIHMQLRAVKADDADARLLCHVSALTGQPRAILGKMDSEDYTISQAIAYFFL